ncbi:hypothetical protein HID58_020785 [Brassica napus]|uniref:Bromo domain-containing protein n=1 Tax=Brassica napus TaxID=3708 RepID=A0ABQ8CVD2_BRANA|nr:hypothetical protein HID58_020785 [Brassica napus]
MKVKFSPVRNNNDRRGRNVRSRYVSDFEINGADYAPQPKRRKKGEVRLLFAVHVRWASKHLGNHSGHTKTQRRSVRALLETGFEEGCSRLYFDIVKRPMDLSTIRDKVRKIEYRNREQFRHDVWQIQLNAHLYNNNGRNPGIQPLADQLLEICDYLLEDYGDQLAEAEKGIDR